MIFLFFYIKKGDEEMIRTLNIDDYSQIGSFSKVDSVIFQYNKIDPKDISWAIANDTGLYSYTFEDYFNMAEVIDGTEDFIKFVEENKSKKWVCISDHDADGILGCVNMVIPLSMFGIDISYIPTKRFDPYGNEEAGYGMKKNLIDKAIDSGAEVIITVDQGITTIDEVKYAQSKGLKVCVTDHHNGYQENPADAVIDPSYFKNKTIFKDISGATVALKLNYALFKKYNLDLTVFDDLGALAGITVCSDVMPLLNENRILYKAAINRCNEMANMNSVLRRIGIILGFVLEQDDEDQSLTIFEPLKNFNKTTIDFYLVPVINAVNRVEGDVTELISAIIDAFYSNDINVNLDYFTNINKERKKRTREIKSLYEPREGCSVIVEAIEVDSIDNYSGIAGLVASDLVDEYKKPALIAIDQGDDIFHFSCRSVSGYNLYNLIERVAKDNPDLNLQYGGHDEALGCSIPRENLSDLRDALDILYSQEEYEKEEVYFNLTNSIEWLHAFNRLAPFGNKFEFPKFYINGNIKYYQGKKNYFGLENCQNKIVSFSKADLAYIANVYFNHKDKSVECLLEICYDFEGNVAFKLIKILNKDEDILEEMNAFYMNYRNNKNQENQGSDE